MGKQKQGMAQAMSRVSVHAVRGRLAVCGLACGGLLAMFAPAWVGPSPRVVYNPSDSAPRGLYAVKSVAVHSGDWIVTRLPVDVIRFAAERAYLPAGAPLLKRVAAMGGDHVCVRDARVWINGAPRATALQVDSQGRPLQPWWGCRALEEGELFLLSTEQSSSFDSRYFGPIVRRAVYGRATPLWTWGSPTGRNGLDGDSASASAFSNASPACEGDE